MSRELLALAKICEKREFLERLRQGYMYMKPLAHFRSYEEKEGTTSGRGDPNEGIILNTPGSNLSRLRIGELEVTPADVVSIKIAQEAYVFCVHATYRHEGKTIGFEIEESNREQLGEFVLYSLNPLELIKRFCRAADLNQHSYVGDYIRYLKPEDLKSVELEMSCFVKDPKYQTQSEYRFAIMGIDIDKAIDVTMGEQSYELFLGDLSDIVEICTVDRFNEILSNLKR